MSLLAVYPGTFDPITNGHVDLLRRAQSIFPNNVVFAIAESPQKNTLLTLDDRVRLAQDVFSALKIDIEVLGFTGLLTDFLVKTNASTIIRGLRAISDFEYELQLANLNRVIASEIETVFLTPDVKYSYISSSLVREISSYGGDVSPFVHPLVVDRLKNFYS